MMCSWDPVYNPVPTNFSLTFRLGTKPGTGRYPCPFLKENEHRPPNTCKWDATTNPIYRQPYVNYTFILRADNELQRNVTFTYKVSHYANGT